MQLTNGLYLISTIATNPWGERWVQRNLAEDRSLLPKPVSVQPANVTPFQWTVQKTGEDKFSLSASHGTGTSSTWTIDEDGKLFSALSDNYPPEEWTVSQCARCDEGIFVVTNGTGHYWKTPVPGEGSQILIEDVILPAIFPPIYPSDLLFNFTQLIS
ncbi:hypothetical protein N0V93_005199 [Gnomoniopsis smithogilvyi]|uniref:Uncharacterized protein n=1 Tax=Gnomoniopsis smithogilvyi TaxID=1191159 RepID=A0A9W9CXU1_9PEZI|nr:hypothetical protein N0V93_005199 [Gnomoniopsis smithogilvyi]